jgi:hypothetical protein
VWPSCPWCPSQISASHAHTGLPRMYVWRRAGDARGVQAGDCFLVWVWSKPESESKWKQLAAFVTCSTCNL